MCRVAGLTYISLRVSVDLSFCVVRIGAASLPSFHTSVCAAQENQSADEGINFRVLRDDQLPDDAFVPA